MNCEPAARDAMAACYVKAGNKRPVINRSNEGLYAALTVLLVQAFALFFFYQLGV